jgi:hypothetical protein
MGDDQQIYWCTWNGYRWNHQQVIPGAMTSSHPALASYADRLYCVYRGGDGDTQIYTSVFDFGTGWRSLGTFLGTPDVPRTSDGVALFAGNQLYMVWKETDDTLWTATLHSGIDKWMSPTPLKGQAGQALPHPLGIDLHATGQALPHPDPYRGDLHATGQAHPDPYRGDLHATGQAFMSYWFSSHSPSIATLPDRPPPSIDRFLLTWKGAANDTRIWQARFEGNGWSGPWFMSDVATAAAPAVAGDGKGRLWRVWRGAGEADIWWSTSTNEGDTWSPQKTVTASIALDTAMVPATSHHPALVVYPWSASHDF